MNTGRMHRRLIRHAQHEVYDPQPPGPQVIDTYTGPSPWAYVLTLAGVCFACLALWACFNYEAELVGVGVAIRAALGFA